MTSNQVFKRVLSRLFEEERALVAAVENPLVPDSVAGLVCPNCGELEANVQKVNDAEVDISGEDGGGIEGGLGDILDMAVCAACGAEFVPPSPSPAEGIVNAVLGERQKILRRLDHVPLQEAAPLVYFITR